MGVKGMGTSTPGNKRIDRFLYRNSGSKRGVEFYVLLLLSERRWVRLGGSVDAGLRHSACAQRDEMKRSRGMSWQWRGSTPGGLLQKEAASVETASRRR
jgi:hypothetical protein